MRFIIITDDVCINFGDVRKIKEDVQEGLAKGVYITFKSGIVEYFKGVTLDSICQKLLEVYEG